MLLKKQNNFRTWAAGPKTYSLSVRHICRPDPMWCTMTEPRKSLSRKWPPNSHISAKCRPPNHKYVWFGPIWAVYSAKEQTILDLISVEDIRLGWIKQTTFSYWVGMEPVVQTGPLLVNTHHLLHLLKAGIWGHQVEERRAILFYDPWKQGRLKRL